MQQITFKLISSLASPPTPPSGMGINNIVNCETKSIAIYGSADGDPNNIQFAAQSMSRTNYTMTGFGILIGRHGAPLHNLIVGITLGSPPDDPFNTATWAAAGEISPALFPQEDTFYWIMATLTTPINTQSVTPYLVATSEADFTSSTYWAWGTCANVPAGENTYTVYGVVP